MPPKKGTRQQPAAANNLEEYKKSIKSIAEDQSKDTPESFFASLLLKLIWSLRTLMKPTDKS